MRARYLSRDGAMVAQSMFGASVPRREDRRLVTGRGRFIEDLSQPGNLVVGLVRSPHAHATIRTIQTKDARHLPGIVAMRTGQELSELWQASVPPLLPAPLLRAYVHPVIARDTVRHVGGVVAGG